eukprot:gene60476-80658_t
MDVTRMRMWDDPWTNMQAHAVISGLPLLTMGLRAHWTVVGGPTCKVCVSGQPCTSSHLGSKQEGEPMSRFVPVDRDTAYLLPPSVDEWLPSDHLARFVVEVIEQLDLSELTRQYAGRGSAAHHPAVLLGLLFGKAIKAHLFTPTVVASTFIIGGLIILWAERRQVRNPAVARIHE